ncbi:MAG TPA: hypothetical protein VFA26_04275 [Gemmataceae bacterium]|nr:hypothetical protein [Gemmataceae bacterium]
MQPFLRRYCFTCHGPKKHEAGLDLSRDVTVAAVASHAGQWQLVRERLQGKSLAMSPALLKKYLAAARLVAAHVVLKPEGFVFAPPPVAADTDRDKYCVQRIIDFYQRHPVDYADCFLAAWRFRHRKALGKPKASLSDFAREAGRSARYLASVWSLLEESPPAPGPLGEVQAGWRKLPADVRKPDEARRECQRLRDLVVKLRKQLTPKPEKSQVKGISQGSQPLGVPLGFGGAGFAAAAVGPRCPPGGGRFLAAEKCPETVR